MKLNFYIIHAKWLKDREGIINDLKNMLLKYRFKSIKDINISIVDKHDPDNFDNRNLSLLTYQRQNDKYDMFVKTLHLFQVSNALKHYEALKDICDHSNEDDINIIVEDDVIYEDRLCLSLDRLFESNKLKDHGLVFLGLPGKQEGINPVSDVFPDIIPFCDSYYVDKKTAKLMRDNYIPIRFINNIQMSYVLDKIDVTPMSITPNLFIDGSKYGSHLSTLTPNNILIFNPEYMSLFRGGDIKETSQLDVHPDYIYLKAKATKDIKLFEKAYDIYKNNSCLLNNESLFLRDYIRIYGPD